MDSRALISYMKENQHCELEKAQKVCCSGVKLYLEIYRSRKNVKDTRQH